MANDVGIIEYLEVALRAEGLRQSLIANNIANIQTPGYRRLDIKFEELLAKALESGSSVDMEEIEAQIFRPMNTPVNASGNDVSLDTEIGEIVKNSLRHETFIRLLRKKYAKIELAMNIK